MQAKAGNQKGLSHIAIAFGENACFQAFAMTIGILSERQFIAEGATPAFAGSGNLQEEILMSTTSEKMIASYPIAELDLTVGIIEEDSADYLALMHDGMAARLNVFAFTPLWERKEIVSFPLVAVGVKFPEEQRVVAFTEDFPLDPGDIVVIWENVPDPLFALRLELREEKEELYFSPIAPDPEWIIDFDKNLKIYDLTTE